MKDYLPLFIDVQPNRVALATLVIGEHRNQREIAGDKAQEIASTLKKYSARFLSSDNIQPLTWDYNTFTPQSHSLFLLRVAVKEEWQQVENRLGKDRIVTNVHITGLSIYDTGRYEGRQYQGSYQEDMVYHINSVRFVNNEYHKLNDELWGVILS